LGSITLPSFSIPAIGFEETPSGKRAASQLQARSQTLKAGKEGALPGWRAVAWEGGGAARTRAAIRRKVAKTVRFR
jgi:hypothetical protein